MRIKRLSLLRSGPAAAAVLLPSDAVFEILSRTPVKSLCRFRCVSREWRALISDPAFAAAHGRNRAETPLLLAAHSSCEPSLPLIDMNGRVVKVIDNLGWPPLMYIRRRTPDHVVCAIASLNSAKVIDLVAGKVLLQTSLKGSIWGFGRATSGAYKLICLRHSICDCQVLTVGEDGDVGWRQKQRPPANYTLHWYTEAATINDTLHVLAEEEEGEGKRLVAIVVLCFDLESEVWKKKAIKGPPDLQQWGYTEANLYELNDALCMVHMTRDECTAEMWLLTDAGDDGGVWSKAYTVRYDPYVHHLVVPLRVVPSDDDGAKLLLFYYIFEHGRVPQLYDPRDGTYTDAMKMPCDRTESIGLCTLPLECFVSATSSVLG